MGKDKSSTRRRQGYGGQESKSKKSETKDEIALLKAQLVRALADYDNLAKRYERDSEQFGNIARTQMLVALMPGLDMMGVAQEHLGDAGLAMALMTLEQSMSDLGFDKIIPEIGEQFDEQVHEAVEVVSEPKKKNGEIVEMVLNGWRLADGGVVRHARVKVNSRQETRRR